LQQPTACDAAQCSTAAFYPTIEKFPPADLDVHLSSQATLLAPDYLKFCSQFNMSQELTHRTIKDGWFMEISDTMWPGEAMSLRVKEILHVEKSKYQDVSRRAFCQMWLG
jgi:hypothetical protein